MYYKDTIIHASKTGHSKRAASLRGSVRLTKASPYKRSRSYIFTQTALYAAMTLRTQVCLGIRYESLSIDSMYHPGISLSCRSDLYRSIFALFLYFHLPFRTLSVILYVFRMESRLYHTGINIITAGNDLVECRNVVAEQLFSVILPCAFSKRKPADPDPISEA